MKSDLAIQIQNIKSEAQTAKLNYQQQQFTNLEKMLNNAPIDPTKATAAQMMPYIQQAMKAGMTFEQAVSYLSNPSYRQQTLDLREQTLALSEARLALAMDKADKGTQAEREANAIYSFGQTFTPGSLLPNGKQVLDTEGYVSTDAWKMAIADAPSEGLNRKQFITEFGYLLKTDKNGKPLPGYGLTPTEIKLVTGE